MISGMLINKKGRYTWMKFTAFRFIPIGSLIRSIATGGRINMVLIFVSIAHPSIIPLKRY